MNQKGKRPSASQSGTPATSAGRTDSKFELKACKEDGCSLLAQALSHWQFGDWRWLSRLNADELQEHSERAELVLLKAAGHLQQNEIPAARECLSLARQWGASDTANSRMLLSGVYNSMGVAAACGGNEQNATRYFEHAAVMFPDAGKKEITSYVRIKKTLDTFTPQNRPLALVSKATASARASEAEGGQQKSLHASKTRPLLIEIMGQPGIGKSTLLKRVCERFSVLWKQPSDIAQSIDNNLVTLDVIRSFMDGDLLEGFVDGCIDIVNKSHMTVSQKLSAINQLQHTAKEYSLLQLSEIDTPIVSDELFMHRAFSLLMHSDNLEQSAAWYFQHAPVPSAVINLVDDTKKVIARVIRRNRTINTLWNLSEPDIEKLYTRSLILYRVAEKVLRRRGVMYCRLFVSDAIDEASDNCALLIEAVIEHMKIKLQADL